MEHATITNTRAWATGRTNRGIEWSYAHPESPDTPTRARAFTEDGTKWELVILTEGGTVWVRTGIERRVMSRIRETYDGLGPAYDLAGAPIIKTWLTRFYRAHKTAPLNFK